MTDNRLIAEFMDLEMEVSNKGIVEYYHIEFDSGEWYEAEDLPYDEWNWLMPVVEKIESLRDTNGNAYRFTIDMCNAQIEGTTIEVSGGSYKLDTTYKAVVEFIKWYNKKASKIMSVNKVLVHTQYYENYGFNEGREAWKPKGSHIFYIEIDAELLMYTNPAEIFSEMLETHNSEIEKFEYREHEIQWQDPTLLGTTEKYINTYISLKNKK
jgi:hypothetical protein